MENIDQNQLPAIYDDRLIEIARDAEKRIEAIRKIRIYAFKVSNPSDWILQNGKPYLQESGSAKIARLYGISWRIDPCSYFLEDDGHFRFEYKGYFSMKDIEVEAIGSRSSRDSFFSKGKGGIDKPLSEIDKGDVQKSALTNCIGNGIGHLLGLKNITIDELRESGLDVTKIKGVEYDSKDNKEMSPEFQDKRTKIWDMIKEMCNNDETKCAALLVKLTSFTAGDGKEVPGKSKIESLTEKQIPKVYDKVLEGYDKWKAAKSNDGSKTDPK